MSTHPPSVPPIPSPADDEQLREALKRCSPSTYEAACQFRATGDIVHVGIVVRGVIERYVERERRPMLLRGDNAIRLVEDLGVDSLTMMEIVMLAEEALRVSISNDELRHLRTLGDVQQFISCKVCGGPLPSNPPAGGWYLDDLVARGEGPPEAGSKSAPTGRAARSPQPDLPATQLFPNDA